MKNIDVRLKLLFLIFILLLGSASTRPQFLIFTACFFGCLIVFTRPPLRSFKRLLIPLTFAAIFFLAHFFFGGAPMETVTILGQLIRYSPQGFVMGRLLALRIASGVLAFFWFAQSSTLTQINGAMTWLRVPAPVVAVLSMTWRYLSVYEEEICRMRQARTLRLGYQDWRSAAVSTAAIGGQAVVRAFDHSERTYRAMRIRGFDGRATAERPKPLTVTHFRHAIPLFTAAVLFLALYVGRWQVW
ncbi:MAG: hypothetical protein KGZ63_04995 [Clostridiales bacterium]|jgi:cobalt/nickel transport system permease protein|nr:hypothetical protein [Clostridiales bacterium]